MTDPACNGRQAALFVAPIMPSDRGNGLAMRAGFLLDSYARRFAVDLAVAPVAGGPGEFTPFVQARVRRAIVLSVATPDTHFTLVGRVADPKARLAAFRQYGRPSITAPISLDLERELHEFTDDVSYAVVHVSRLYLAGLAAPWIHRRRVRPYLVLDCDEDDATAYRRFARLHRMWGRSQLADWAEVEAEAFEALAGRSLAQFDLLLAASAGEARALRVRADDADVMSIPNVPPASGPGSARPPARQGRRDILFVGNMGYLPNVDAVTWFVRRVWPRLRSVVPFPLRFVIAGHGAPREVRELARTPGIVLAGGFDDAAALYRRAALAVVPIRAGGGTRIKLLEGAKYGVPVVATRFGAEGSGFRSGQELLLADNERDFAAACARLLTDFTLASRLAAKARCKLRRDYDAKRLAARLLRKVDASIARGVR